MKLKSFKTLVRQVINENRESREASATNRRKLTRKYSRYSGTVTKKTGILYLHIIYNISYMLASLPIETLVGSTVKPPPKYENTYRLGPQTVLSFKRIHGIFSFAERTLDNSFDLLKMLDLVRFGLKKEKSLDRYK